MRHVMARRRALLAWGSAAVTGLLAACRVGAKPGEQAPAGQLPAARAQPGPLYVLDHSLQQPIREVLLKRIADFERDFPGARVEYDDATPDNSQKFPVLIAAGTIPDVSVTHTAFVDQYPYFADLMPYLAKDRTLKREDYFPTIFDAFKVPIDGMPRQIGIPREVHVTLIYYNRNMALGAGLREPSRDWTHMEFVEFALKLTRWTNDPATATWAIQNMTGLGGASGGLGMYWQFGAEFFSADGRQCLIDQPESRQGLQWLLDLIARHHIAPSPSEEQASGLTGSQQAKFGTGRFAMYASNQNTAPVGTNAVSFEWDIQALPQVPGKKRATRMAGNAYGILMQGMNKNLDLSYEFIKYFIGEEGSKLQVEAGNYMAHRKAAEEWARHRGPSRNGKVVGEILESWARLEQTRLKNWGKAMAPIHREWTAVQNGQRSLGEAIDVAKPEAEAALRSA